MTETPSTPDLVDNGASDVMSADEVVDVPAGSAELAASIEHIHDAGGFIADIQDWNEEDPLV